MTRLEKGWALRERMEETGESLQKARVALGISNGTAQRAVADTFASEADRKAWYAAREGSEFRSKRAQANRKSKAEVAEADIMRRARILADDFRINPTEADVQEFAERIRRADRIRCGGRA